MKKPPLERIVQKKVLKAIRARGGEWDNTTGNPMETRGRPDIIGCYLGRYVAFEVKRDAEGKLTDLQAHKLKRIRAAGGVATRIHSVDMALAVLDRLDAIQEARLRKRNSKPPRKSVSDPDGNS
jgi:hypothetical protein